jgi:hypothetical protein
MRRLTSLALISIAALTSGCSSLFWWLPPSSAPRISETLAQRESLYSPIVSVYDYHGAEGFGRLYVFTSTSVVLVSTNDFGRPFKEIYRKGLAPDEIAAIRDFVVNRDFGRMKELYVTPGINDGLQVTVKYYTSAGPPRTVQIRNAFDSYVYETFEFLDEFLEANYKMQIGKNVAASSRYRPN